MTKWICPNVPQVPAHPEVVLYTDQDDARALSGANTPFIKVPPIQLCSICKRHYMKSECIEVTS